MIIKNIKELPIEEALGLHRETYERAKKTIEALPPFEQVEDRVKASLSYLVDKGIGLFYVDQDQVVAYIVGYRVPQLFGKDPGVYVPLQGFGVLETKADYYTQKLYDAVAAHWVEDKRLTHSISLFATDPAMITTWFENGFGMRCVDGIRPVAPIHDSDKATVPKDGCLEIRKVSKEDVADMVPMFVAHLDHFGLAPIFMGKTIEDPLADRQAFMDEDQAHMWIAYEGDQAVGYLHGGAEGETYVSLHESVLNINGAYVPETHRGRGIMEALLERAMVDLKDLGYTRCGVDYESINPSANRFWRKYFTPYTHSLVRRIDDRFLKE